MPVIGIVVGAIGSAVGTAIGGAIGGTIFGVAASTIGGVIGAGLAGGLFAAASGGSFGKGFLSGAVGAGVGAFLSGGLGSAAETFNPYGEAAGTSALTMPKGLDTSGMGDLSFNTFADVASATGESLAGSLGTDVLGGASMGDISTIDSSFDGTATAPSSPMLYGEDVIPKLDVSTSYDRFSPDATPFEGDMSYQQQPTSNNPFAPEIGSNGMQSSSPGFLEGISPSTPTLQEMQSINNPGTSLDMPRNMTIPSKEPMTLVDVTNKAQTPNVSINAAGAPSNFPSAATPGINPLGKMNPSQSLGKIPNMVNKSDEWLNKNFGLPKGSTGKLALGGVDTLYKLYNAHKLENQVKGTAPLSFEQFQAQYTDPNAYRAAANNMAKAGHTGTLPILLARMKNVARGQYANYLPGAQQKYLENKAGIAGMKNSALNSLFAPFGQAWGIGGTK